MSKRANDSDEEEGAVKKRKPNPQQDFGFDLSDSDDEGDSSDEDEVETKKERKKFDYNALTKHGYKEPEVKITLSDEEKKALVEKQKASEEAALKEEELQRKVEAEALAKLQNELAYDPKKDAWRRRGKLGGETPADTWKREQKKVSLGLADAGGGMKHMQWTQGCSMEEVKSMRSSYD